VGDAGSEPLREALALVAPGTALREGLDRVLQAKRGALVVIGDDPVVLSICTGGFLLDAEFSPQRLSELAKMDGAVILASDASRIARANVHLVPKASIPTSETGTRHRTAERVARSLAVPVITVSEAMATIAVFRGDAKHTLPPTARVLAQANQAIATLQRFKTRFDQAVATLSALEVEDTVSVRDVVAVLQPAEMVVRISEEIDDYLVELGTDGRLIGLQLEEIGTGVDENLRLVVRDYALAPKGVGVPVDGVRGPGVEAALAALHRLSSEDLLDPGKVAATLGLGSDPLSLDAAVEAQGFRLLRRLPRISDAIIDRIVARFVTLPRVMGASIADLETVDGVGEAKARSVKDGLARMVEAGILERYQ
jgi:diadenylate cyclase